jgi:hypothetical protein
METNILLLKLHVKIKPYNTDKIIIFTLIKLCKVIIRKMSKDVYFDFLIYVTHIKRYTSVLKYSAILISRSKIYKS